MCNMIYIIKLLYYLKSNTFYSMNIKAIKEVLNTSVKYIISNGNNELQQCFILNIHNINNNDSSGFKPELNKLWKIGRAHV